MSTHITPDHETNDALCRYVAYNSRGFGISWYLMASFTYHHLDIHLVSEECYGDLCQHLHDTFDRNDHWHCHLLNKTNLAHANGAHLDLLDYPLSIRQCAEGIIRWSHPTFRLPADLWVAREETAPTIRRRTRVMPTTEETEAA